MSDLTIQSKLQRQTEVKTDPTTQISPQSSSNKNKKAKMDALQQNSQNNFSRNQQTDVVEAALEADHSALMVAVNHAN